MSIMFTEIFHATVDTILKFVDVDILIVFEKFYFMLKEQLG